MLAREVFEMSYDHCIMFRFVSVSNFCLAILGFLGNLRIERFI